MPINFPFKIGADPEFNIILGRAKINALNYLEIFKLNNDNSQVGEAGEIGVDGHAVTAEIRPSPENSPEKLVGNIGALLKVYASPSKLPQFSTLSYAGTVGGHIHFDLPPKSTRDQTNKICKLLSLFYLPLALGEDNISNILRNNQNYGRMDDWRGMSADEDPTTFTIMEYRVPTAEWMTTPKLAHATIAYLAVVYEQIINFSETFEKPKIQKLLSQNKRQMEALQELANSRFSSLLEIVVKQIRQEVKNFHSYKFYKKEIEFVLNPKKVIAEKESCNYDIIRGWNFCSDKEPSRRQILNSVNEQLCKQKKLVSENAMEKIWKYLPIYANPDKNVEIFAAALKVGVVVHDWRLKNYYYLFGVRSKVEDFMVFNQNQEVLLGENLINSQPDFVVFHEIIKKMHSRINNHWTANGEKYGPKQIIYIGLPKLFRDKINRGQLRKFLSLIHKIEKNKFKPQSLSYRKWFDSKEKRANLKDDNEAELIITNNEGEDRNCITSRIEIEDSLLEENNNEEPEELLTTSEDDFIQELEPEPILPTT